MTLRRDLDGLRLQLPGNATIYLMDAGQKRAIVDPPTYNSLFRDWGGIVQDIDINEINDGPNVTDGTVLVQGYGEATVYLVDVQRKVKRPIASPQTMDRYYFSWSKIIRLPPGVIALIPDGSAIAWPEN